MMKNKSNSGWPIIFGLHWKPPQLGIMLAVVFLICISIIFTIDQEVSHWFRSHLTESMSKLSYYATYAGDAAPYIGLSLLSYLFFRFRAGFVEAQRLSLFIFSAFIFSGILVHLGKFSFGRQRPYHSDELLHSIFDPFTTNYHFQSLPSGHSQVIFTAVAILSLLWPRWNLVYFLIGVMVAVTRISLYYHFLSDIIAGAAVGIIGVTLTYRLFYVKGRLPFRISPGGAAEEV